MHGKGGSGGSSEIVNLKISEPTGDGRHNGLTSVAQVTDSECLAPGVSSVAEYSVDSVSQCM